MLWATCRRRVENEQPWVQILPKCKHRRSKFKSQLRAVTGPVQNQGAHRKARNGKYGRKGRQGWELVTVLTGIPYETIAPRRLPQERRSQGQGQHELPEILSQGYKGWECSSVAESVSVMRVQIPGSVPRAENTSIQEREFRVGV